MPEKLEGFYSFDASRFKKHDIKILKGTLEQNNKNNIIVRSRYSFALIKKNLTALKFKKS